MRYRKPVVGLSLFLVALSLGSLFFPGPNYGIDFAGGTEIQLAFSGDIKSGELRTVLGELGYQNAAVVNVEGRESEYMIRIREVSALPAQEEESLVQSVSELAGEENVKEVRLSPGGDKLTLRLNENIDHDALKSTIEAAGVSVRGEPALLTGSEDVRIEVFLVGIADELVSKLQERLGERGPQSPDRIEWVGPKAGAQLRDAAVKSLAYAIAFIMMYVALRFDLRFAPGGVLAMFHDAIITLGIYVVLRKEVNLTTVGSFADDIGIFDQRHDRGV